MNVIPLYPFACCILVTSLILPGCANQHTQENLKTSSSQENKPTLSANVPKISLREFYKLPIGPRGIEPTEKLLSLKDKQIRVVGYMVKEEEPTVGLFMLSPVPVSLAEKEDGPADDMPVSTLFVHMPPKDADKAMAYRPGLWELTGTLRLGNLEEANGRVSYTQLILD